MTERTMRDEQTDALPTEDQVKAAASDDLAKIDKEWQQFLESQNQHAAQYMPWGMHETAENRRNLGIRTSLGEPFQAMVVALRQFSHDAVLERQEFVKRTMMNQKGLDPDNDHTPIVLRVHATIEALADQAIRKLEGQIDLTPFERGGLMDRDQVDKAWAFAKEWGTKRQIDGLGERWIWEARWDDPVDRKFQKKLLIRSQTYRDRMFKAASYIKGISDLQILELGKELVLGRDVGMDLRS